jgi:hypothetical protein
MMTSQEVVVIDGERRRPSRNSGVVRGTEATMATARPSGLRLDTRPTSDEEPGPPQNRFGSERKIRRVFAALLTGVAVAPAE